jgi:hypothetical protein
MAERSKIDREELEREQAEALPEREAMSLLDVANILGGTLPTDPMGAGDATGTAPAPEPTQTAPTPGTPLTDIAGNLANTAADAAASDADGSTTTGGDGEHSSSDSAVSQT